MEAGKSENKRSKKEPADKAERPSKSKSTAKDGDRGRRLRWGVIALALVVGFVAWLGTRGGEDDSGDSPASDAAATRVVTVEELREVGARLGQPIYWAGPVAGTELVLTELDQGVQLAYQPEGAPAGVGSEGSLTVGSYPLPDPIKALRGFAKRPGTVVHRGYEDRAVVVGEQAPTSAYFVDPANIVQVEVYDPSPERALEVALSRRVQPVG